MKNRRKIYSKLKPSGVEWLGDVPKHWEIKRIPFLLERLQDGTHFSPQSDVTGDYLYITAKNIKEWGIDLSDASFVSTDDHREIYKRCPVKKGDILYIKDGATAGVATVNPISEPFSLLSSVAMMRPRVNTNDAQYIAYHLNTKEFKDYILNNVVGGAMTRFTLEVISKFRLLVPPLPEQQAIAAYLDRATGRIDTLVAKKKQLVELLKEKRTALISHAVTKGLSGLVRSGDKEFAQWKKPVEYKPSGVDWLGDVPEHWGVLPLKRIVAVPVTDGPHETPEILDEGIPFVSAEAIRDNRIDFEKKRGFISIEDHRRYSQKYKPQRDDIFMIKSGATTGNMAIVETNEEFNIWSPLAVVRANTERALPRYILAAMNSQEFQTSVQLFWSFGTQQNIGMNVIENLPVPLPALPEQEAIAAFLDRETGKIDNLIAKVEEAIGKLTEYRTALISAAVTGKIDIVHRD